MKRSKVKKVRFGRETALRMGRKCYGTWLLQGMGLSEMVSFNVPRWADLGFPRRSLNVYWPRPSGLGTGWEMKDRSRKPGQSLGKFSKYLKKISKSIVKVDRKWEMRFKSQHIEPFVARSQVVRIFRVVRLLRAGRLLLSVPELYILLNGCWTRTCLNRSWVRNRSGRGSSMGSCGIVYIYTHKPISQMVYNVLYIT